MAKRKNNTQAGEVTGATVGYEAELWRMADALRGSMDAAEYKHVVREEQCRVIRKPYNTPKKFEKQVEIIGNRELNNQRTPASYADRKWHTGVMWKPYNQ